MNIKSAYDRLAWRFSTGKSFTPNEADKEALKFIAEWINREKQERVFKNRHFAKLVVSYYGELLISNGWDTDKAEKTIQQILSRPLEEWYTKLMTHLNTVSWVQAKDVLGLVDEHNNGRIAKGFMTAEQRVNNRKHNAQVLAESEDVVLKSVTEWDLYKTTDKLNHFISELLNKYGNTP